MPNDITKPTTGAPAKRDRAAEISPKLRLCLDAMVEDGLELMEAAKVGGMTSRGLRLSLTRPVVRTYLRRKRAEYISEIRATTPRRMREIRDQNENWAAAVRAGLALETIGEIEEREASTPRYAAGLCIIITPDGRPPAITGAPKTIEATPAAEEGEEGDE